MSKPPRKTTIKLRGHHLLCLLSYRGKGYTPDFTANFNALIDQINRGATVEISSGPDELCGALRYGATIACEHAKTCHKQSVRNRDRLALKDIARALHRPLLRPSDRLTLSPHIVRHLRHLFAHGGIRSACVSCPFRGLCSQIAADNFAGTRLIHAP
jgi:hypothetical protein